MEESWADSHQQESKLNAAKGSFLWTHQSSRIIKSDGLHVRVSHIWPSQTYLLRRVAGTEWSVVAVRSTRPWRRKKTLCSVFGNAGATSQAPIAVSFPRVIRLSYRRADYRQQWIEVYGTWLSSPLSIRSLRILVGGENEVGTHM